MNSMPPSRRRDGMAPDEARGEDPRAPGLPRWRRAVSLGLKALLPVAILAGAAAVSWQMLDSAPVAERGDRTRLARLVEVTPVAAASGGPVIEAWGDVAPSRTLTLRAEAAGKVTELNPALVAGGEVRAGDRLVALDDRDQRLALSEAEAKISEIDARIQIEKGQAARAAADMARLPGRGDLTEEQRALILRKPQMAELAAQRDAAIAARDAAKVALDRTRITAPFDALVLSADIAEGTNLTTGTEIAQLVPVDGFEVRLAMPVSALPWLDVESGETARLTAPGVWPDGAFREGRIERVAPRLNQTARMADVIVTVADPLARTPEKAGKPPLLLGSFLRAQIEGHAVPGAVAVDRAWLRDGDTVWVMDADDRLAIRPVTIAWRGPERVLVTKGLEPGDRVVTTPLATVSEGMALRLPRGESRG